MRQKQIEENENARTMILDFTIVIYHNPERSTDTKLKTLVSQCFGPVLDWFRQERHDVPEKKPNLREPKLKIFCRTDGSHFSYRRRAVHEIYALRLEKWMRNMDFYPLPNQKPWIELHSNDAFPVVRAASHEHVAVFDCCFGSLVLNSQFAPSVHLGPELVSNFFHDTRNAEVTSKGALQVRFKYSSIRRIVIHDADSSLDVIFLLAHPPVINSVSSKNGKTSAMRIQTLPDVSANTIGLSNALKIKFPKSQLTSEIVSRLYFRCGKKPVAYTRMHYLELSDSVTRFVPQVDLGVFKCTYMLTALLGRTPNLRIQQSGDKWSALVEYLKAWAWEQHNILYLVLCDLVVLFDEGAILDYLDVFEQLRRFYLSKQQELHMNDRSYITPDNTRFVWRATITPTRCLLGPSAVLFENRILRKFDADYACRVIFRDDDGTRLNLQAPFTDKNFYEWVIKAPMTEGMTVGPRCFQFLGWSNSQIREHGVWMYARDQEANTADTIRNWMGDFSHITSVPKFMARMGQCFSQTKQGVTVPLSQDRIRQEPDIMGGLNPENNKPYCFTDGVGKISLELLKKVCKELKYEGDVDPSAIQFRYGGCKGMLVLDPTLEDVDIVFRDSQHKFPCAQSQELEICKVSCPMAVNLNRQLIAILDHMGIDSAVFLELQKNMLGSATDIFFDLEKAVEYLGSRCALNDLSYRDLADVGVELNSEPFFRTMLLALHIKVVQGIKNKARLEINPDFGRNMFGVVDETGKLEYGQVFVKYSTDVSRQMTTSDSIVLEGRVLVTKNPCMHPGDVRVLEAVDVPELHHIVDCIVFPHKGHRPHPNEMSGSDLDGDEYTVIWYKPLLFSRNAPASHFPIPEEQFNDGEIDENCMLTFLCEYIRDDQVGLIGNAHLAQSDSLGFDSPVCQTIARKFSIAVDFPKNGQLVTLEKEERVQNYPDFMEKTGRNLSYRSKKTLGKLYRVCKDFEDEGRIQGLAYEDVKVDPDMMYPGWENFKESAKVTRNRYNRVLDLILKSNALNHEAEAFAQANVKLQEQRDRADVEELVMQSLKTVWLKMRREFMDELQNIPVDDFATRILQKASAWYYVTYADPRPVHLSFAWIMSKPLQLVKTKALSVVSAYARGCTNSFLSRLQEMLDFSIAENQVEPLPLDLEKLVRNNWSPHMPPVENLLLFLRVVIHWAHYHGILNSNHRNLNNGKAMTIIELVNPCLRQAMGYPRQLPLIDMILRFLKLCVSLRFQIPVTGKNCDPSLIKKVKYLGCKAMYTYHCLGMIGNLSSLGLNLSTTTPVRIEEQEMDPVCLSSELIAKVKGDFQVLKDFLIKESGVSSITVRPQGRSKYLLSASGTPASLKLIRNALGKSQDKLLHLGEKMF